MSDSMGPDISVVMPVFNGEKYLDKAICSILNQSYSAFEFIIIDDGSTDKTLAIIERYAEKDKRIHLVSRENRGVSASSNEAVSLANTSLVARMDADDIALPDRLKIQKKYMDSHPGVVAVGSKVRVIDHKGRFLINTKPKFGNEAIVMSALQGVSPIVNPSAMIQKEAIHKIGGYKDEDYPAEDLALWLNLSEVGQLENLDEVLLEYRIHDNSISTSDHKFQMEKTLEVCERACKKKQIPFEMKGKIGRPLQTRSSKFEITLRHGWWAHSSKQWYTSAVYALKAMSYKPMADGGWRLLFCSFFRRQ